MKYKVRFWKHFLNRYYAEIGTDQFLVEIKVDPETRKVTDIESFGHSGWAGEEFFEDSTLISKIVTINYSRDGYPRHVWEAIAWRAVQKIYGDKDPMIPKKTLKLKSPDWFNIYHFGSF
jgi:hypothetical protein